MRSNVCRGVRRSATGPLVLANGAFHKIQEAINAVGRATICAEEADDKASTNSCIFQHLDLE